MTHDSMPGTASPLTGAGTLGELVAVLAEVLGLKAERIDPEQTFQSLGVDSLLTMEFVATVNAAYGTRIKPTAVYDHPTPAAFARHVAGELGVLGPRPAAASGTRPKGPASRGAATEPVLDVLRVRLADILCCDPWEIDESAAFTLLGLDSILGAEFVACINHTYGLEERAVTLYDHPSLAALAAHVAARMEQTVDPAPAPRRPDEPVAADIEELLNAVRDDRLSIDEAAALLAAHSG